MIIPRIECEWHGDMLGKVWLIQEGKERIELPKVLGVTVERQPSEVPSVLVRFLAEYRDRRA